MRPSGAVSLTVRVACKLKTNRGNHPCENRIVSYGIQESFHQLKIQCQHELNISCNLAF